MKERLMGIFSEESFLGRITSRIWILFGANLMFIIFSIPVVTLVPAWVAMYHVCLKTLRQDSQLNPFVEFWRGFRANFKQAFLSGLAVLGIAAVLIADIFFVSKAGGFIASFRWPVYLLTGFILLILFHFFPVMAAFADSVKGLLRNSLFFAAKNPLRSVLILAINVLPLAWTYKDVTRMPLYAFIWASIGFAGTAMIESHLLLRDFSKYLPEIKSAEELDEEHEEEARK